MNLFLRKITGTGIQLNIPMGDEGYTFIDRKRNEKEFDGMKDEAAKQAKDKTEDCIYAFIVCCGGSKILALSNKQSAYIMTETGKTFANVSQR